MIFSGHIQQEFLCLILKLISYTSDTLYFNRTVFLEMVTKAGYVDIEATEVEVVVVAPEFLQKG